jgi:ElaB/YqjD/DUF883 family membrane-anchored ribosome-binding protein
MGDLGKRSKAQPETEGGVSVNQEGSSAAGLDSYASFILQALLDIKEGLGAVKGRLDDHGLRLSRMETQLADLDKKADAAEKTIAESSVKATAAEKIVMRALWVAVGIGGTLGVVWAIVKLVLPLFVPHAQ